MIEIVFSELKKTGVVQSSAEFSRDFLGMEESYLRGIRARNRIPSAKALAACAVRLKTVGKSFSESQMPIVAERGELMIQLGDCCINEILSQAMEAH